MSLKPPHLLKRQSPLDGGVGILDGEIIAEMAASLGRAGRALEAALDALATFDRDGVVDDDARETLLHDAATKAWALLTQYELCGLSTQTNLVQRYRIPDDVMVRVGAAPINR